MAAPAIRCIWLQGSTSNQVHWVAWLRLPPGAKGCRAPPATRCIGLQGSASIEVQGWCRRMHVSLQHVGSQAVMHVALQVQCLARRPDVRTSSRPA